MATNTATAPSSHTVLLTLLPLYSQLQHFRSSDLPPIAARSAGSKRKRQQQQEATAANLHDTILQLNYTAAFSLAAAAANPLNDAVHGTHQGACLHVKGGNVDHSPPHVACNARHEVHVTAAAHLCRG
jgi:hypothetical protein